MAFGEVNWMQMLDTFFQIDFGIEESLRKLIFFAYENWQPELKFKKNISPVYFPLVGVRPFFVYSYEDVQKWLFDSMFD